MVSNANSGSMWCCGPKTPEQAKNKEISKQILTDAKVFFSEVKILLLGAGESGKSTIAKQMKILHCSGFPEQERLRFRDIIYYNIVTSMKTLIQECRNRFMLDVQDAEAARRVAMLPDLNGVFSRDFCRDITSLWSDPAIKQTLQKAGADFYVTDNVSYYFSSMERLCVDGYVPNEQDILNSRNTTTGIHEIEFVISDAHFRMIDVGGQRTERRKWIHCFEGVTAVLFCVAMSEYDQKLLEDDEVNRMKESLTLFAEVCRNPWFADTAMILFLNKKDLFEEKIRRIPLSVCFPEYTGENDLTNAGRYIQDKFAEQTYGNNRPIYPHFTCATDTGNIAVVFQAVRDIVLRAQLRKNGMI